MTNTKNMSCALLVATLASIASCADTSDDVTTDAVTDAHKRSVIETCGEQPTIPQLLSLTYRTEPDGQVYAVLTDADFQLLQYYLGINALWASCARDF